MLLFAVVVTFMPWRVTVDFGHSEGKKGEREQFECVLSGGAVGDFGEERVLGACFLVGRRLESANRSLDCKSVSSMT